MAEANPRQDENTEKAHCPICLGEFKIPRQLPCLHSFCQGCLEDYISSKAAKMKELKECECPICRTMAPIPRKSKTSNMWASLFPIDSILQSIAGKDNEDVHRPCDCCVSDGVSITARGFCVVCEEAMCETCQKVHQRQKATKDHSIVPVEELTKSPQNLISFNKGFRCQEHEEKELKFYCKDHKIACCSSCCIIHHRNCSQVSDLRKDTNGLLQEVKPLHVLEEIKTIENYLMNFERNIDSNIVSLESQVQDMAKKIQEIRKKLNDLLDDLEGKVKAEGNQLYKQESIRKQEQNHACQALLNAVRNSHTTLDTVMKHGSDMQIFLMADRMISQMKLYNEQIKETFGETEAVTLNLAVDPQIQCVLAQRSDIGRVICRKERKSLLIPSAEKPLKECQIEREKVVEIKGPDDNSPVYSGVTYLQEDQVMLADSRNNRVLLLSSSYQCISCFTLSGQPRDICVGDRQAVAVSVPNQKTIQFMSVTSRTIKPIKKVQTRYECWGIAPAGNGNIIVSGDCKNKGKHYWSLITSTGEEKYHQFDCQCDPSFTNAALNSSRTRVYITVFNANSLYCFDMDGRMMYKYNHDDLLCPLGVATDRDDNVYVVGNYGSDNIHQLTSDGTKIRIINYDIPDSPYAICFNNSHDKFVITNDGTKEARNKIYLFRFK